MVDFLEIMVGEILGCEVGGGQFELKMTRKAQRLCSELRRRIMGNSNTPRGTYLKIKKELLWLFRITMVFV